MFNIYEFNVIEEKKNEMQFFFVEKNEFLEKFTNQTQLQKKKLTFQTEKKVSSFSSYI